jgi:predicted AlkP superfamily pyrophosphatase or phosphodiesterase
MRKGIFGLLALASASFCLAGQSVSAANPSRRTIIVLVLDGLRPDMIRPETTPNLYRLKQEGVWGANSHSVFPTVTRVNSASISTGATPASHGIVSNTMYVPGVGPKPFDTADYPNLVKLAGISGGHTLAVTTLAETLQAAGLTFVALSSGSSGSGFLLNPMAPSGVGMLINGGFEDGRRVAWPDKADQEIRQRFGTQKPDVGTPSLLWTERVARDYVLSEIHPQVMIDWFTEPDTTQHRTGVGSPESLAVIRTDDEQVGLLLGKLRDPGLADNTDIIVTADHGFAMEPDPVDFNGALQATGKADDIIVAGNGASVLLYAKDHDSAVIGAVVAQLQKTDGVDLIFTAARQPANGPGNHNVECSPGKENGWVPGTFSLELIDECRTERAADIIVTFQWNSEKTFGFPGSQRIATADKRRGVPGRAGHGGLNPWMVHTPLILWGPDFRKHTVINAPTANYDIAPTILQIEGVTAPASMTGRVIAEGLAKQPRRDRKAHIRSVTVRSGAYCASIQLSELDTRQYVDQGQRCRH